LWIFRLQKKIIKGASKLKSYHQELIENLEQHRIGLDDVFAFKCRECGKCCKNREDILLNSRDVYKIATALDLTHEQVIEKYCDTYIGNIDG
jgi:hypothetical protein